MKHFYLKSVFNCVIVAIVLILSGVIANFASHAIGAQHGTILGFSAIVPVFITLYMFSAMALGYIAAGMLLD